MTRTWWKEAVIYQIYPRSFRDSDGDGIGDLKGIEEKLDYLKELGVDVIWLGPVYKSPNDDYGYDVSDYYEIMDEFGSMEDWTSLCSEIHCRGMKIMMDIILNHTSDEHAWFQASKTPGNISFRDYYYWREGDSEPNNWESFFGGSAWKYDEEARAYYLHLFSVKQPDLNWSHDALRKEMYSMMRFWLDKGVDAFRLDAVNLLVKPGEWQDGEPAEPDHCLAPCGHLIANGEGIHDIFQEMNNEVFSRYPMFTVAEMAGVSAEEGLLYTDSARKELDSIIYFEHMDVDNGPGGRWETIPFSLQAFKQIITRWQIKLQGKGWIGLYLNNHDQPRVVSRWGNDIRYRVESAKMFATCIHMLQGSPYIYQGEEIGMTNIRFDSIQDYRDVETLNYYRIECEIKGRSHEEVMRDIYLKSRDNARTPMQWDDSNYAGFGTVQPWIDVNPNYKEVNVEKALADPGSVLHYYRELIRLRKRHEVIVYGDYSPLLEEHSDVFAYRRTLNDETLFVITNFSEKELIVDLGEPASEPSLLLANYPPEEEPLTALRLRPFEARIYLARNNIS
ncbi:oligo-1,6-glucosidase [Paenibacillus sophorae]|uniref:oligo-1,6-glucosidase n=1 Tax=Paenibacillus sophorae TaxID=1333845 RepID=A0A1H8UYR5_9BACL|nr:alpha-glucosidase [Paenibacillus sophorae]QWU15782.1 alpha-glucosidase [Paenibacillus sophorae]SEP08123.1 oligo-1,6-glucosidase [Paenibacillus sophorae]